MDFSDLFCSEPAAARNGRAISSLVTANVRKSRRTTKKLKELYDRVADLEQDLDFLALIVMSVFSALNEKGVATPADVLGKLGQMDQIDGVQDGKITPEALRKAFGFAQ